MPTLIKGHARESKFPYIRPSEGTECYRWHTKNMVSLSGMLDSKLAANQPPFSYKASP